MYRPRILVVEKEANARNALHEILEDAGYDVVAAANGDDGMAVVETFHPEVLLTDVRIPRADGRDRARASPPAFSAPRTILMATRAPDAGEDAPCLAKPLDVEQLLAVIGRLLMRPV